MRNRWFHRPQLRASSARAAYRTAWLDRLFDAVAVVALLQLAGALAELHLRGEQASALRFGLCFAPIWLSWTGHSFYQERFDVDDVVHRALVLLQLCAVSAMSIAVPEALSGRAPYAFALAYAPAASVLVLLHARAFIQVEPARAESRRWGIGYLMSGVAALVAPSLPEPWAISALLLGHGSALFSPLSRASRALSERFPRDRERLGEAFGFVLLLLLAGALALVLQSVSGRGGLHAPQALVNAGFGVAVVFGMWWIYFDDVAGTSLRPERAAGVLWWFGHLVLIGAATAIAAGLRVQAVLAQSARWDDEASRWLLGGSLALGLLGVAMIDGVTARSDVTVSDAARIRMRLGSALFVVLITQIGHSMDTGLFLGLLATVCLAQAVHDLSIAPMSDTGERARPLVELMQKANEPEADSSQAPSPPMPIPDATQAVRKGMPSELRHDLYYFFMDGSWARLLSAMLFVYLVGNVFFAALFLLEPGAIAGMPHPSFADAFFFSVQTMSTIGYGAMSPGSSYGNAIVTFEAAVGILGVALATGLTFAKVSRATAKVLFARRPVITTLHGRSTLMFRAGNARGNDIVDASITVSALVDDLSPEGQHLRRLHDLALVRNRSPAFSLSWSVMHVIDEDSPLFGIDWAAPDCKVLFLMVTLVGHDGTYGQTVYARQVYRREDVLIGHRFVDIISQLPDGRLLVDYERFHDTVPE